MSEAFEEAAARLRNAKTKEEADEARRAVRTALYPHSEKGENAPRGWVSSSVQSGRRRRRGKPIWE